MDGFGVCPQATCVSAVGCQVEEVSAALLHADFSSLSNKGLNKSLILLRYCWHGKVSAVM